ncbi:ubiquinol-cytochrome c reductase cytochrome b subunit, partial [Streptomyces beijiangensis]|nr:ubiquinol-cytochrome c reductase cytochrome b subunit [Streptomyces beijiangensis]
HGEFVEVHEPLTQAQLHKLTAHEQPPPFELGPLVDANGVQRSPRRSDRLRARLAHAMYGPGSQVPKATVEEYRAIDSGDQHHH